MKEKFLRTSLTFFFVQRRRTALRRFFFADWKAESEGGNNQVNESSSRSISSYTLEAFTSEFMTDFHFRKALDFFSIRWSHGSSKQLLVLQQQHSVWKSQKKSHSTLRAKRATFTFFKSGQKWIKNAKNGLFWRVFESLPSNSVTRQVTFNREKNGRKCQNINNQCDILSGFQTFWNYSYYSLSFLK